MHEGSEQTTSFVGQFSYCVFQGRHTRDDDAAHRMQHLHRTHSNVHGDTAHFNFPIAVSFLCKKKKKKKEVMSDVYIYTHNQLHSQELPTMGFSCLDSLGLDGIAGGGGGGCDGSKAAGI